MLVCKLSKKPGKFSILFCKNGEYQNTNILYSKFAACSFHGSTENTRAVILYSDSRFTNYATQNPLYRQHPFNSSGNAEGAWI